MVGILLQITIITCQGCIMAIQAAQVASTGKKDSADNLWEINE
jgi:hypothetical protein